MIFDGLIIGITLLLAIKGFFNGFIKEVFGLIGIIGGVYLAGLYYHPAGVYINENLMRIPNKSAIDLVGFVSVFLLFWIFCIFIGFLIANILKISALGFIDKILGFIFGGLKFFLIITIIVAALYQIKFMQKGIDKLTKKSILFPIMLDIGDKIIKLSPEDIDVKKVTQEIKKGVKNINISK